jgi:hypothetical protein
MPAGFHSAGIFKEFCLIIYAGKRAPVEWVPFLVDAFAGLPFRDKGFEGGCRT